MRHSHLVGRYPGWRRQPSSPSQTPLGAQWLGDESEAVRLVRLPLRGQRWLEVGRTASFPQLPVELPRENPAASTNCADSSASAQHGVLQSGEMAAQTYLEQITERVERLLLRHEELLRTNELLAEQLRQLGEERDGLRLKLQTALERIDAVLAQIPPATEAPLE
ncbi:MAG: hypothetical protein RJA36_3308 [Pseudomonadota bacterium]